MDWVKYLQDQVVRSPIILASEVEVALQLDHSSVRRTLGRLQHRGLVERITNGIYLNALTQDFAATDVINVLRPNAYVSLDSALRHWGISTQSPSVLTCVTTGKPKEYRSKHLNVRFRTIAPKLYWGFKEKATRYGAYKLAEPEKALLDWVYLALQNGIEPALDELNLRNLDRSKLFEYANKYPSSVLKHLLPVLALSDQARGTIRVA